MAFCPTNEELDQERHMRAFIIHLELNYPRREITALSRFN